MTPEKLEIYKQRYETFRHLDKLRWQMLQIAIATVSAILILGKDESAIPMWWVSPSIGLILIILGLAMIKIGEGIRSNGKILYKIASEIGDGGIPKPRLRRSSVSFWIALMMIFIGIFCFLLFIIKNLIC